MASLNRAINYLYHFTIYNSAIANKLTDNFSPAFLSSPQFEFLFRKNPAEELDVSIQLGALQSKVSKCSNFEAFKGLKNLLLTFRD